MWKLPKIYPDNYRVLVGCETMCACKLVTLTPHWPDRTCTKNLTLVACTPYPYHTKNVIPLESLKILMTNFLVYNQT